MPPGLTDFGGVLTLPSARSGTRIEPTLTTFAPFLRLTTPDPETDGV